MASGLNHGENSAFEDFIRNLEKTSDEWVQDSLKGGKKGRQRKSLKNKNVLKDEDSVYDLMVKCRFDRKVIDLRCRETCSLPSYGGVVVKTGFELFVLPSDYYFSVVKTSEWVGKITEYLFDIREGVISKNSRGFLDVELFNRKNLDLRLDQGCLIGQVVIKKFEY